MSGSHPLRPVFILGEGTAASQLKSLLASRPGWVGLPPLDLLNRMSRLLWGHQAGAGDAGVSSLVDRPHLLASLRRLSDALVSSAVPHGASFTVDTVTKPELLGPYLRDVWPDALVVALGDPDSSGAATADPDVWLSLQELETDLDRVGDRVEAAARESVIDLPGPPEAGQVTFHPEASRLYGRVVIVLGAARSGTTWLHRLLSASPQVVGTVTGETWLFPDIAPLWVDEVRAVAGDDLVLTALRAFCDDLLSGLLKQADATATHVCEKTPTTVWHLGLVTRLYPDAHYVHVIRDGRDAAVSLTLTRGEAGDLRAAATEWVEAIGAVRGASPDLPRMIEVRYEDLLADPQGVVERIWQQIGVPITDDSVAALAPRIGERVTPLPASGEIGTGKWRSLGDTDRELLEKVTGGLLRELGYRNEAR